uniref:Uncharacterized protein LOC114348040 n=1 Tax=Diabrotica virgifera virgifera TaxID=50390 RepID=A0A6P7H7D0_DIAVI
MTYYKNHFKDTLRQYCLDLMQGVKLYEVEIQDFWSNLLRIGGIANEILPEEIPSVAPHLALQPEFEFARAVYQISRSVPDLEKHLLKSLVSNEIKYKISI